MLILMVLHIPYMLVSLQLMLAGVAIAVDSGVAAVCVREVLAVL